MMKAEIKDEDATKNTQGAGGFYDARRAPDQQSDPREKYNLLEVLEILGDCVKRGRVWQMLEKT